VVVAEHRGVQAGLGRQVAPVGAEVAPGGPGRVEDVAGVLPAVGVAVGAPVHPGGRNELHRPDRPVIDGVAVVAAVVGVGDDRVAGDAAVEPRAQDPTASGAVGVEPARLGVPGLGVPDAGQQPPGQLAGRLLDGQPVGGEVVSPQHHQRNADRPNRTRRPNRPDRPGRPNRPGRRHLGARSARATGEHDGDPGRPDRQRGAPGAGGRLPAGARRAGHRLDSDAPDGWAAGSRGRGRRGVTGVAQGRPADQGQRGQPRGAGGGSRCSGVPGRLQTRPGGVSRL